MRIFSDGPEDPADGAREEDEGGEEGEGAGQMGAPALEMGWQYMPELAEIHHPERRKRICLAHLNTGLKIIRLLAAIEARPELDVDGLIDALEYAAWDCHGQGLGETLEAHADGSLIAWSNMPTPHLARQPASHTP